MGIYKFTWLKAKPRQTEFNAISRLTSNILPFIPWIFNLIMIIIYICSFPNDWPELICHANVACGQIADGNFANFDLCSVETQLRICAIVG